MSGGLDLSIEHSAQNKIRAVFAGLERGTAILALEQACERAAQPGLSALRAEVATIGRVTGNLAASVGVKTKIYLSRIGRPTAKFGTAVVLVGFMKDKAHHAHLVEFGTGLRARRQSAAFSSKGRFVGAQPFVSRARFVGRMPALHPVGKAFLASEGAMKASLEAEMGKLMEAAARSAAAEG